MGSEPPPWTELPECLFSEAPWWCEVIFTNWAVVHIVVDTEGFREGSFSRSLQVRSEVHWQGSRRGEGKSDWGVNRPLLTSLALIQWCKLTFLFAFSQYWFMVPHFILPVCKDHRFFPIPLVSVTFHILLFKSPLILQGVFRLVNLFIAGFWPPC